MAGGSRSGGPGFGTALRFALREMRGGLKGFYVFIACIAIGVGTIAGVGSLAKALSEGIVAEGQTILGGDLDVSLIHRQASAVERAFLDEQGRLSEVATLRAMVRKPDASDQALVEIKAVDDAYPLYGTVELSSGRSLDDALAGDAEHPALADPALLARLDVEPGDTLSLGRIRITLVDTIEAEPDKLSGGVEFGPRLMVSVDTLEESGLVQPGSLVRWHYRVAGESGSMSDARLSAVAEAATADFPDAGWRIRARTEAAPGLRDSIERFAQFLTLVGLTALVVGGVGVANAVRAYLDRKRAVIATFRCLGADGTFVFTVYLAQIVMLAGIGIAIGLAFGAVIPPLAAVLLVGILPVSTLGGIYPGELVLSILYGLLTALAFALWPLGRAHDVPPTALFRGREASSAGLPKRRYLAASAAVTGLLVVVAVALAHDRFLAFVYVVAVVAAFLLLRVVAWGIMALARIAPHPRATGARLALGNIHRRGALTPTVVLSLGLGLALLVTLALIDGNLRNTLTAQLPERAPSFFFVDIQDRERDGFLATLEEEAPDAVIEMQPMLRGRIVSLKGIAAADYDAPEAEWVLRGDRGITYAADKPENSTIVEGAWWPEDYDGTPQVSFAAELAQELGLSVGDPVTVNVLGRTIETEVANLRTVAWESLSINFVMIFSPNTFAGAPHAHLATLTYPDGGTTEREVALLRMLADAYPTVTAIRVKDALDSVNSVVADIALAIRAAASVTLIASMLVLGGALAASHRSRIYDAVVLKTLGATRGRLVGAFALEYAIIGAATAIFAILAGSVAAWYVLTEIMEIEFALLPLTAAGAVVIALAVTVGLGLIGTWRALGEKPTGVLRDQ
ncbi:ABC transporter permease [Amorphus orientalis]|uniref:ABC transport system permease protein n=1 Tax=Amorphus orientalis TaxID=649198 RepID=A0AAE4AQE5_9HYPH|nr:ABC transporter permease [Amorphus orientalis]MDQ0313991.1 putative ABC transport system permease protein [Amorphus orientalis]